MSGRVYVNIRVHDANDSNVDAVVIDELRVGDSIPEKIGVLAAEAAAMANLYVKLGGGVCIRDKTKGNI